MPELLSEIPVGLSIAASVAILAVLMVLSDIVDLAPALLGCLVRGKENINLYNNVKMRRMRNRIFAAIFPVAYIILSYYPFHPLVQGRDIEQQFMYSALVIAAYLLARLLCQALFFGRTMRQKEFQCGAQVFYTFAVICMLVMFAEFGVCRISCVNDSSVAVVIQWTFVGLFGLFLIREFQVFAANRGYLAAFLYLCGLEILPAGLLAVSYFVL